MSWNWFFRGLFTKGDLKTFLNVCGLLVFSGQDLSFSCVYVLSRNSLNISGFLYFP